MALINISTDHIKLRKTLSFDKKPLMLKDYLIRDDLSSCSSSGFKSFPRRRQCCTTVRFLLEADLKKSRDYSSVSKRLLKRSRNYKPEHSTPISATLQRASEAVLNAVKRLSFPSIKSSLPSSLKSNSSWKGHYLSKSFSRKFFKRSFWRRAYKEGDEDDESKRWRSFREFLQEKNQPSDQNTIAKVNTTNTSSTTITTTSRVSTSTSSNSNSWDESEFTADNLQSSSGNSESTSRNDSVESQTNLPEKKKVSNIVGITVDDDSIKEQDWPNEEGKEQFSPVCVLDCPFDDEEEDNNNNNNSSFQYQLARVEGTKLKLVQKIRRFESLAQVEPVELEKRIAVAELGQHNKSLESPVSVDKNYDEEKDIIGEADYEQLLQILKSYIPSESLKFMVDNVLLDFFRERLTVDDKAGLGIGMDIVKAAEDWVNGNPREMVRGWEVQEGREAYVKEMDRNDNWGNLKEGKKEVGFEVFSRVLDELLIDLF